MRETGRICTYSLWQWWHAACTFTHCSTNRDDMSIKIAFGGKVNVYHLHWLFFSSLLKLVFKVWFLAQNALLPDCCDCTFPAGLRWSWVLASSLKQRHWRSFSSTESHFKINVQTLLTELVSDSQQAFQIRCFNSDLWKQCKCCKFACKWYR